MGLASDISSRFGTIIGLSAGSNTFVSSFLGIRAKIAENLVVIVRDQFDTLVTGATITVNALTYQTDSLGVVDIPVAENTPTTVAASKTGYTGSSQSVTVPTGGQKSITIVITATETSVGQIIWFNYN